MLMTSFKNIFLHIKKTVIIIECRASKGEIQLFFFMEDPFKEPENFIISGYLA